MTLVNFLVQLKPFSDHQINGVAPLKSKDGSTILKNSSDIRARWREHFKDLLNQSVTAVGAAISTIPKRTTNKHMSTIPTLDEVKKAVKPLRTNKALGLDGIPTDIYNSSGNLLHHQLHQLIMKIWVNKVLPSDFIDAAIVTIYKKKGDKSDCGNYRGISLLSTAGKILARILNNRLRPLAEAALPETQPGFRPTQGTSDMIFTAPGKVQGAKLTSVHGVY